MSKLFAVPVLLFAFASGALAADLKEDLLSTEKALWTAWGKKDGQLVGKHLTPDSVQVVAGTAPVVGRDNIVKSTATLPCELRSFAFSDATLRRLAATVAVLSYTATQDASCEGKKLPPKIRSTAIYVQQGGKWLVASYQETPLE